MLMSDVTYLMDESLSKLSEIHQIQTEMKDKAAWEAQPPVSNSHKDISLVYSLCTNSNTVKSVKAISVP